MSTLPNRNPFVVIWLRACSHVPHPVCGQFVVMRITFDVDTYIVVMNGVRINHGAVGTITHMHAPGRDVLLLAVDDIAPNGVVMRSCALDSHRWALTIADDIQALQFAIAARCDQSVVRLLELQRDLGHTPAARRTSGGR